MARKRMIDPGFWTDEKLGICTRDERLLFMALISNADDAGLLQGHPALIKSIAFPYDLDVQLEDIETWVSSLNEKKMLISYQADGQRYIQIKNFLKYQTINRPSPSKYPAPPSEEEQFTEDSLSTHEQLTEDSLPIERKGKEVEEKGKEREEEGEVTDFENDCLTVLKTTPGYPFDMQLDLALIRGLMTEFPEINVLEELKKWGHRKKFDEKLTKKNKPRGQIRNWLLKAREFRQKKGGQQLENNGTSGGNTPEDDEYNGFYINNDNPTGPGDV